MVAAAGLLELPASEVIMATAVVREDTVGL